jgi:hypothetical protein
MTAHTLTGQQLHLLGEVARDHVTWDVVDDDYDIDGYRYPDLSPDLRMLHRDARLIERGESRNNNRAIPMVLSVAGELVLGGAR